MILLTGATGFVGRAFLKKMQLVNRDKEISAAVRVDTADLPGNVNVIHTGDISPTTSWNKALQGIDTVMHLAARAHIMNDPSPDPLAEFRRVNVQGTIRLAQQAAYAGVKRFVFLSSIKVNGESTLLAHPFTADDEPAPEDPYGISKQEAEKALMEIARETGMEVVVIRSPLVYGPGVKANFKSLMCALSKGMPLPLAALTKNRRSLVAIDNLIDLLVTCMHHPAAADQIFLVSDGEDLSTAELLKRMGLALNAPARLFYVPTWFLEWGAYAVNRPGVFQRLSGSLQIDIHKTRRLLDWSPPISIEEGFRRAAQGFIC